jgi:UDP-2-acetamido-3-amino-2,3-dideoxy-glucuronate N-acetyltransferase
VTTSIHKSAICESTSVGSGTRIWAFVHILANAYIGEDCNICDFVFIENDVRIGDRVTIKSGVQIWDGIQIEDDVFIGPNVSFTNDKFPRSRQWLNENLSTKIRCGASIGAGATILPGITIGEKAMIGAGAVVTSSIPPFAIAVGNPAKVVGFSGGERSTIKLNPVSIVNQIENTILPNGAERLSIKNFIDNRGELAVVEFSEFGQLNIRRSFFINAVPEGTARGNHAHRECTQILICLSGSLSVFVDDGSVKKVILLNSSRFALVIPPMMWSSQFNFSTDAVLAVFASHDYDEGDYISDYSEFKKSKSIEIN